MLNSLISLIRNLKSRLFRNAPSMASYPLRQHLSQEEAVRIIDSVEHERRLTSLPLLYWVLIDAHEPQRTRAAAVVDSVLRSIKPGRLPWIDRLCRERSFSLGTIDWSRNTPENLISADLDDRVRLSVYGFASFHPNGFVREKAVQLLAADLSGSELPYLLIRMNDWVEQIRRRSKDAISSRVHPKFALHFVVLLPLLQKAKKWGRGDHKALIADIEHLISADKAALLKGLTLPDAETRRISYKYASSSSVFSTTELLDMLLQEPEPSVRAFALRQVAEKLTSRDIETYASRLLADPFASIRAQAIGLYCRFYLSKAEAMLRQSTIDVSLSVRETARYYLRELGMSDFASFYRGMLSSSPRPPLGLILGIDESGSGEDSILLEEFLEHPETRFIKAAIRGISMLAPEKVVHLIFPFISDGRPGISKAAMKCLRNRGFELEAASLASVFKNSSVPHVRRNSLHLLCSMNHWDSIAFIIEACGQDDPDLRQIGTNALAKWFLRGVRTFDSPSFEQAQKAKEALAAYARVFDPKTTRELLFHLK